MPDFGPHDRYPMVVIPRFHAIPMTLLEQRELLGCEPSHHTCPLNADFGQPDARKEGQRDWSTWGICG